MPALHVCQNCGAQVYSYDSGSYDSPIISVYCDDCGRGHSYNVFSKQLDINSPPMLVIGWAAIIIVLLGLGFWVGTWFFPGTTGK